MSSQFTLHTPHSPIQPYLGSLSFRTYVISNCYYIYYAYMDMHMNSYIYMSATQLFKKCNIFQIVGEYRNYVQ